MGREIRRVPPNWEHPKTNHYGDNRYQPMFDQTFENAAKEWKAEFAKWESGERPDYCTDESRNLEYWEWDGSPPDREFYRTYADDEATWFQVYETVSEGTPVTPPFETKEDLVNYLSINGDFWQQKYGEAPYSKEAVKKFVYGSGWAPSMVVCDGKVYSNIEASNLPDDAESD